MCVYFLHFLEATCQALNLLKIICGKYQQYVEIITTPIHAKDARFNFGTGKVGSLAVFASATILAFGKRSDSHTVTTIFPFCRLDSR